MKTIKVHIARDSQKASFDKAYVFPTKQDRVEFFKLIGDSERRFEVRVGQKLVIQHFRAWDVMRSEGWVQNGYDDHYLIWNKPDNELEELEICLKKHDWWYQMSDDHRYFVSGDKERAHIEFLMRKVDRLVAVELYNKYAPTEHKMRDVNNGN